MIYHSQNSQMAQPTGKYVRREASRIVATILLILIGSTLGGCATYRTMTWGPPPPDLSGITVGSSRAEVEERLDEATDYNNNVYHYEYNTEEGLGVGMGIFADLFTLGTAAIGYKQVHRAQRRHDHIVYGPDGRVAGLSRDWADETFRDWLHGDDQEGNLSRLCLAAMRGDAGAQYVQAMRYRYGLWNTERDSVEALAWMKFAAFSGHPGAAQRSEQWASRLGDAAEEMFQTGGMRSCGDPSDDIRDFLVLRSWRLTSNRPDVFND